ncbi:unnamed protein product [Ceratitis capitata]|uniref:(Mediterranean fruit fly) hypothetical protein n=1 Tax=Ceratitis capitata TaxID=7213 RepID=A0A811VN50_CERCA|nr:unnamed protein product [Ceratitis capitata]
MPQCCWHCMNVSLWPFALLQNILYIRMCLHTKNLPNAFCAFLTENSYWCCCCCCCCFTVIVVAFDFTAFLVSVDETAQNWHHRMHIHMYYVLIYLCMYEIFYSFLL